MTVGRWCVPAVVAALVATGCTRASGGSAKSSSGSASTTGAASRGTGDFGTLTAVCGPGDAKGATAPGVTDGQIRVGTMADPGAAVQPGLDQELFDTADAFVGWCNAAGGVLGRKLVLDKWDSQLTEVSARMIQACAADFALVGNGEALDATGVQQRTKCGLPEIAAYDVSAPAGSAPNSIQPIPTVDDASGLTGAFRAVKAFDPAAIAHYGLLSSQFQSVKDSGNRDRAAAAALGYHSVYYDELPLTVDNWRPYAQNVQSKGVQVLGVEQTIVPLYKSLADVGYTPKYAILNTNQYDSTTISVGGDALKGRILVTTSIVPFELAGSHPATKQYVDILAKYAHAKPKALGVSAFSAWLLWAESVKACGSNVTRDCVMSHAGGTHDWTGAGLHAPSQPGNATAPQTECFVLIQVTPQGFVVDEKLTKPNNDIFNCSPDNVLRLPGFPPG